MFRNEPSAKESDLDVLKAMVTKIFDGTLLTWLKEVLTQIDENSFRAVVIPGILRKDKLLNLCCSQHIRRLSNVGGIYRSNVNCWNRQSEDHIQYLIIARNIGSTILIICLQVKLMKM
ncbi:hypothetical protein ACFXTN_033648 [Malus domestica]